jgi:hypothetical protein
MTKRTTKGSKPMDIARKPRTVKGVRLDLSPDDHQRLEKQARMVGLSLAAYARQALFERLEADERKRS